MRITLLNTPRTFFFILLTLLGACDGAGNTSSNDNIQPLMTLTGALAAVSEHLSGTYAVYSATDTLLLNGELLLTDDGIGNVVVSSPTMTLERNTVYRFIIVYFWDGAAIAYVDSTQTTENDETTSIAFTADSIEYAVLTDLSTSESAAFDASVSTGILPDLDLDDDGYSNFIELRSGTDPSDASSLPTGPTITDFAASISADGNTLTITATITDGNGVSDVALSFPNMDYLTNILATTVSGADGDDSRTVSATFNPQYAPLGELEIQLSASDDLELNAEASLITTITHNGTNEGPVIDFESPSATGAVLSGTTTLSVRAYDATDGVTSLTLTQPANLTDLSSSTDLFTASWNTITVSDNIATTLTASAIDGEGAVTTKSITVTISNGADLSGPTIALTVDGQDYASLGTVNGSIEVRATATDATGVASLSLDNESDIAGLTVTEERTTLIRSTVDTTQYEPGQIISLSFEAFDTHGYESTTVFTFTVGNDEDRDGINNAADNCPTTSNATQANLDSDGEGDECDNDVDGDGVANSSDAFPTDATETTDTDLDGIGNNADNCLTTSNATQANLDSDGEGDACDNDADGDGSLLGIDCNDSSAASYPGATEILDGFDNDCEGTVDYYSLSLADIKYIGEDASDQTGKSVSGAGDVNGDGYADILVGAYGFDGDGSYSDTGAVYLIYGGANASGSLDLSLADAKFIGENAGDRVGVSVSSAGDVNGDGKDDILISTPYEDGSIGAIYLIYGQSSEYTGNIDLFQANAKFTGENTDDYAGQSVSSAGDVNGDGYDDILIGSYSNTIYLIYGGEADNLLEGNIELSAADAKFIGEDDDDFAGYSISNAGDVNGDTYDDILIGASYGDGDVTNSGAAYLIYGQHDEYSGNINLFLADAKFMGENYLDYVGGSVSSAGDVNGDGYDDILVGAYGFDGDGSYSDIGAVYLIYGQANDSSKLTGNIRLSAVGSSSAPIISGSKFMGEDGKAGRSVSSAGDVNDDGFDDILIGAPYESSGTAYLLYGGTNVTGSFDLSLANAKFTAEAVHDYAGESVSGAGDVNGDGKDDILIGAPDEDSGGNSAGAAYLILSQF